ncbi:putative F-box/LRR-repeat protein At3g18150 isoform X3 [Euphorbia lathyris]|uniref:putative F-box/LRR-repeat protein At3g18150 isoform X3 n=1 Tax=Euphorbia lathyris TaxID=212925 RepID=UPI0033136A0E
MEEESNSSDEEFDSSVEDTEESDSWVDNTEEESDSSDDDPELQEKQDRISALPDLLIHHILSLLPSTKQAIQTGILSKRWRNQWARVPVLIFECQEYHDEYFERFIDNSLLLYDCSKIKKFHIACRFQGATNFTSKILFATRRNVEELILDFYNSGDPKDAYMLPKFIFDNSSLVELQVLSCEFQIPREGCDKTMARKILMEIQHFKELKVRNSFVKIASALHTERLSYPLLHVKCLTLDCPYFEHTLGIVNVLRCSPELERLVIKLDVNQFPKTADLDLKFYEESYWMSNGIVFTCLMTHLKTVKIIGLSKKDGNREVLSFVEFLLKNSRVLEKMVLKLGDGGTDFLVEVSQKLLSIPRCSQHAIIELL